MIRKNKISYVAKVLPSCLWRQITRRVPSGPLHLIFVLADHFEPYITLQGGMASVARPVQIRRVERWCSEYPKRIGPWRDHDGKPFVHTYFFPAEHYDPQLLNMLAEHCHAGWGEIEIHLHHGIASPDTVEGTRRTLVEFRDALALHHQCLALEEGKGMPRYAFAHGNFALANSASGRGCGVDCEMQILAETGCYADFTLPTGFWHPAQTAKINSLYECSLPLDKAMPHRRGKDLMVTCRPETFPLIVQGPLSLDFGKLRFDNAAITRFNPASIRRLALWKSAAVHVLGQPNWLFIKLHAHAMDPAQQESVIGEPMAKFLQELVEGSQTRKEMLHFVSAREMVNIMLAACDGCEGDPGIYRDYRFKRFRETSKSSSFSGTERSRLSNEPK